MNWHNRFLQQAGWTRHLRAYLFERAGLAQARRRLGDEAGEAHADDLLGSRR